MPNAVRTGAAVGPWRSPTVGRCHSSEALSAGPYPSAAAGPVRRTPPERRQQLSQLQGWRSPRALGCPGSPQLRPAHTKWSRGRSSQQGSRDDEGIATRHRSSSYGLLPPPPSAPPGCGGRLHGSRYSRRPSAPNPESISCSAAPTVCASTQPPCNRGGLYVCPGMGRQNPNKRRRRSAVGVDSIANNATTAAAAAAAATVAGRRGGSDVGGADNAVCRAPRRPKKVRIHSEVLGATSSSEVAASTEQLGAVGGLIRRLATAATAATRHVVTTVAQRLLVSAVRPGAAATKPPDRGDQEMERHRGGIELAHAAVMCPYR
jgi:hypothetical protein